MAFQPALTLATHGFIGYDPATGIYRPGGSILCFGALSCTTNQYLPFGASFANATTTATIGLASIWLPRPGKLLNMLVVGGAGSGTAFVYIDGVATALTRSNSGSYTKTYNYTDVVDVAAGARLSVVLAGAPTGEWFVSVEFA